METVSSRNAIEIVTFMQDIKSNDTPFLYELNCIQFEE